MTFGRSPLEESDYKMMIGKVPLVYLNTPVDFGKWRVALRRLVKGLNMGDALMFSVPKNQYAAAQAKLKKTASRIKQEEESKHAELEKYAL